MRHACVLPSLLPQDVMSAWHTGSFRKPEFFPGEAGDVSVGGLLQPRRCGEGGLGAAGLLQ